MLEPAIENYHFNHRTVLNILYKRRHRNGKSN